MIVMIINLVLNMLYLILRSCGQLTDGLVRYGLPMRNTAHMVRVKRLPGKTQVYAVRMLFLFKSGVQPLTGLRYQLQ